VNVPVWKTDLSSTSIGSSDEASSGPAQEPGRSGLLGLTATQARRLRLIGANMQGDYEGWFRIQVGALDQWIVLVAQPRHFGGRQWYFLCPVTSRLVSVLWKPPGASRFVAATTGDGR
jgi:hypothetical protein